MGDLVDNAPDADQVVEEWNMGSIALAGTRRFVTPDEFRAGVPDHVRHSRVVSVVVDALAAAADDTGVITAFTKIEFYENHIAGVLDVGRRPGETVWHLRFDKFTSMMLDELLDRLLVVEKLFAIRQNGDELDYRLMLPT